MSPVLIRHAELPSTHEYAIDLVSKTAPQAGTVIVAAHQTHGLGRFDREWKSAPGANALLSCILHPTHLHPDEAFFLNVMATLATIQLLDEMHTEEALIKWPNDVLVNEKKIAGILIHNQFNNYKIASSVVSIGLNVKQIKWPDGILATSIQQEIKIDVSVDKMIDKWLDNFFNLYTQNQTELGRKQLLYIWKSHLLGFNKKSIFLDVDENEFEATLADVQYDGRLVLMKNNKKTYAHMDDLRFRRLA